MAKERNNAIKLFPGQTATAKSGEAIDLVIQTQKIAVDYSQLTDISFNRNSPLPRFDEENNLINTLSDTLYFASKHLDKELTILGHADSGGSEEYNQDLSEQRALAIKAILDFNAQAFAQIAIKSNDRDLSYGQQDDVQDFLQTLYTTHNWKCDVNNLGYTQAVILFQQEYNQRIAPDMLNVI